MPGTSYYMGFALLNHLDRRQDPIVLNTTKRRKLTTGAFKKLLKVEKYMQISYQFVSTHLS